MPRPVLNKKDFVQRYEAGEFGNHSPTWPTLTAFYEQVKITEGNRGVLYHLRNRVAGGPTYYNVPNHRVDEVAKAAIREGVKFSDLYVSEMAPTDKTVIQGEATWMPWGLYLHYSTLQLPMRDALRKGPREARGIIANLLLQHYMDPTSFDWFLELLREYDGAVIEFSCYDCCWGTIPGRNTVIWEIRNY